MSKPGSANLGIFKWINGFPNLLHNSLLLKSEKKTQTIRHQLFRSSFSPLTMLMAWAKKNYLVPRNKKQLGLD